MRSPARGVCDHGDGERERGAVLVHALQLPGSRVLHRALTSSEQLASL
jgi:hypothetical protein